MTAKLPLISHVRQLSRGYRLVYLLAVVVVGVFLTCLLVIDRTMPWVYDQSNYLQCMVYLAAVTSMSATALILLTIMGIAFLFHMQTEKDIENGMLVISFLLVLAALIGLIFFHPRFCAMEEGVKRPSIVRRILEGTKGQCFAPGQGRGQGGQPSHCQFFYRRQDRNKCFVQKPWDVAFSRKSANSGPVCIKTVSRKMLKKMVKSV